MASKNSKPERDRPNVVGAEALVAKHSAVTEQGKLRLTRIHDVVFRPTRPVPHEDGHVTEVARADWDIIGGPVLQVHLTTTFPGRHRAWGLHQRSTDRLFVASGGGSRYDLRRPPRNSPTYGRVNEFTVSEEEAVRTPLMCAAPSPVPTRKCGRQMDLKDRPADDVPIGSGDFGDMSIFVRDRPGGPKTTSWRRVSRSFPCSVTAECLATSASAPTTLGRSRSGLEFFGAMLLGHECSRPSSALERRRAWRPHSSLLSGSRAMASAAFSTRCRLPHYLGLAGRSLDPD